MVKTGGEVHFSEMQTDGGFDVSFGCFRYFGSRIRVATAVKKGIRVQPKLEGWAEVGIRSTYI